MPLTPDVRRSIDQIRPCKGPAAALQDLIGGSVHCGFLAKPTAVAHVKRGKLIGLAVTAAGRSPVAMKLPTMSEAGSAGFEASFGQLLLAPKGIPPAVVAALNETFSAALARADARAKMLAMDLEFIPDTPEGAAGAGITGIQRTFGRRHTEPWSAWTRGGHR